MDHDYSQQDYELAVNLLLPFSFFSYAIQFFFLYLQSPIAQLPYKRPKEKEEKEIFKKGKKSKAKKSYKGDSPKFFLI